MTTFAKIYALLTPKERRGAMGLLVLMVVGMVLETMGVGLIVPAIAIMMQDDLAGKYRGIAVVHALLGNPSQLEFITAAMIGLVAVYLLKNLFLAFLIWKQTYFTHAVYETFSDRLYAIYLRQPYVFHLQRNSAQLIRNISTEVYHFATGVVASLMMLLSEVMVLSGLGILLLIVEPLGALTVAVVLGGSAWLFNRVTALHVSRWGVERQLHDGLRIQHLQQGLGGVKDVKLLGREKEFLVKYYTHNRKSTRVGMLQNTFLSFPRLMFELLAITGLSILVLSMINRGRDMTIIVPTMGLFATAAFRIMPSINRVLGSVQTLRYNLPVVKTLSEEFSLISPKPDSQPVSLEPFRSELRLQDVAYQYPSANVLALDGISVIIRKGESIGLIGSSGSGKSTLVDVILGLLPPKAGQVLVDGHDVQQGLRQWQNQIGYVPQSIYLTDDTLRRNVAFGLPDEQIDDLAVSRAIRAAQLDEFVSALPNGLETEVGERGIRLSGGQRQRIGIARALYHDPSVLVLDEATSALDGATERGVMAAVTSLRGNKTIIVVAHRLSTVENCDRLYRLEQGRVVGEGAPKEILACQTAGASS